MTMSESNRTSLQYGLICLLYLLAEPYLAAEISAVFKIAPILFLCALTIKSAMGALGALLLAALLFSMGGDILLEVGFFVPGLVSFLIAQLLYGSLFLKHHLSWAKGPAISLAFIGFSSVMAMLMWRFAGEMRIPVLAYLGVITFMGLSANTSQLKGATLGAAVFIFSDSIIAINRFVLPIPASDWLIMVSYYLAQYCLVKAILKHKSV